MADLQTKITISADAKQAMAAVEQTVASLEKLRADANKRLNQIKAFEDLRAGMDALSSGVVKSKEQLNKESRQLAVLGAALTKAGIDTRNLAAEKARLEAVSIRASRGIVDLKTRLDEMRGTAATAGQAGATFGAQFRAGLTGVTQSAGNATTALRDGMASISQQLATIQRAVIAYHTVMGALREGSAIIKTADDFN